MANEKLDKSSVGEDFISGLFAAIEMPTGPIYFVFCRLYPVSPSHHGSVWVLLFIFLLLSNTVSPMRAYLITWWERFRGTQKEDERGPLIIQSSLRNAKYDPRPKIKPFTFLYLVSIVGNSTQLSQCVFTNDALTPFLLGLGAAQNLSLSSQRQREEERSLRCCFCW